MKVSRAGEEANSVTQASSDSLAVPCNKRAKNTLNDSTLLKQDVLQKKRKASPLCAQPAVLESESVLDETNERIVSGAESTTLLSPSGLLQEDVRRPTLTEAESNIKTLQSENKRLKGQVKQHADKLKRANEENRRVEAKVKDLNYRIMMLEVDKETLQREKETLQREKETLELEKKTLQREKETLELEKKTLQQKKDQLLARNVILQKINRADETELAGLLKTIRDCNLDPHKSQKCCRENVYEDQVHFDAIYDSPEPHARNKMTQKNKGQRKTDFNHMSTHPSKDVDRKNNYHFTELRMNMLIDRACAFKIFACDFVKCKGFQSLLTDFTGSDDVRRRNYFLGAIDDLRKASHYLKERNSESELGHTQMYNLLLLRKLVLMYCIDDVSACIAPETLCMILETSSKSGDPREIICTGQTDILIRNRQMKSMSVIEVMKSHTLMSGNGLHPREQLWLQMEAVARKEKCKVLRGAVLDTTAISLTLRVNGSYYVSRRVTQPWHYIECLLFLLYPDFNKSQAEDIISCVGAELVSEQTFQDDGNGSGSAKNDGDDDDNSCRSDQSDCDFKDSYCDGSSEHEDDHDSSAEDNIDNADFSCDSNYHNDTLDVDDEECEACVNGIRSSVRSYSDINTNDSGSADNDSVSAKDRSDSVSDSDSSFADASSEYDSDINDAISDIEDTPYQVELMEENANALRELRRVNDNVDYERLGRRREGASIWNKSKSKVYLCREDLDELGRYSPDYVLVAAGLVKDHAKDKPMQHNPSKLPRDGKIDEPVSLRSPAQNLVTLSKEQPSSKRQYCDYDANNKENAPENRRVFLPKNSGKPQRQAGLVLRPAAAK